MKLILAVVQDKDWQSVARSLIAHEFRFTRLSSMGGFLRRGNATLMIGVDDSMVETAIALIREACKPSEESVHRPSRGAVKGSSDGETVGAATIFVLNMESQERV